MGDLTKHFSLAEFESGSQGAPIPPEWRDRIHALCWAVLEPIRHRWGQVQITSGYRPASTGSQHSVCEAADIYLTDASRDAAWRWLLRHREAMPIDQAIIYEDTTHLHISVTADRVPRRDFRVGVPTSSDPTRHTYPRWAAYKGPLK